jgi:PAS domain S-box-containing protein
MADIKKLLRRNRFSLEILGIVCLAEFAIMQILDQLASHGRGLHANLLDALGLILISAPLIIWRSRAVHGREMQNLANAVQSSNNAIMLLDAQGRIYWVNQGFTRITGYTLEEALGVSPDELLGSGLTDDAVLQHLHNSRVALEPCRVEMCNRRKNGQLYWVDIDFRPDLDVHDKLLGFIEICTDITELKQAKLGLKASLVEAEALRHAVDTHAIVSVADRAGLIIEVNPALCAISGYSREQLIGSNHRLLNSGTHAPEFWTALWDTIAQGKPWRGEICNRNSQGQLYWVDSMIAPIIGGDGHVEKYVSIRIDITPSKLLEQERERQSRLLAEVMDSLPYGTVVFDEKQVMRLHNPQYAQVLKLPPKLLEQLSFCYADQVRHSHERGDYGHDYNYKQVTANFQSLWDARRAITMEIRQWDSSYIELRAIPIAGGWTVITYLDITERKRQEQILSEAEERVRLATESAGIGIWSYSPTTGLQSWDAQQYRLFGLTYDANPAASIFELWSAHLHPEDAAKAHEAFHNTISTGVAFEQLFRIIRADGAVRHIKALGSARRDAQGMVEYIVGTNMDVTDAELLAQSMQEARLRAEEASRVKSQFMANMSHEIRTPMNGVLGLLQLLEYTVVDARQQTFVTQAQRASRQMVRMIDSVLDFSKLEENRMLIHCDTFGLDEWLEEMALVLSGNVGDKPINVLFDVQPDLPAYLVGDRKRLQQVLFCLLDNAIKFTACGEVVLQMTQVQQTTADCRLVFCVRDTGIGIAPDSLHSIFVDFVQLESDSTRTYGGFGLGLAVAQRLVKLMGSHLEVQSQPGEGSIFSFTLDLAMPEPHAVQPLRHVWQAMTDAVTLVVDASATARSLILKQLDLLHGFVESAHSSEQALALVRRRLDGQGPPYTQVLLDWNMPDADSWQTLQQMRALYSACQHAQPYVVMLSNNINEAQQTRLVGREGLANAFLAKPFTHSMLLRALTTQQQPFMAPVQTRRLQGLHVLVVEDNPINQHVMQQMLVAQGATVCLAGTGLHGVDAVRASLSQQNFDVVLMDIQMPVMDGYQASRKIRDELAVKQLPIIAVSANVAAFDQAQSMDAGMNAHIGKPYVVDELVAAILHQTGLAPVEPAPVLSDAAPQAISAAMPVAGADGVPLHACWLHGDAHEVAPDADLLLQQGVVLHLLDSVEALALHMTSGAPQATLVLADLATATSEPMRALRGGNGASIKSMLLLVLADTPTEEEMQTCIRAGAVDMVSARYAVNNLGAIARQHINAEGVMRVDPNNLVTAIDGHGAMARIQSDHAFFGSLLRELFDELPQRWQLLREAWGHDPDQVKHRSHSLKGLGLSLGLTSLAQVAVQAEVLSSQSAGPMDAALLQQLEAEMQSARFHILRWFSLYPDAAALTP